MAEQMQSGKAAVKFPPTPETCMSEIVALKERLNSAERMLSDFSKILKASSDVEQTDMEIRQIKAERSITDLEIAVEELKNGGE